MSLRRCLVALFSVLLFSSTHASGPEDRKDPGAAQGSASAVPGEVPDDESKNDPPATRFELWKKAELEKQAAEQSQKVGWLERLLVRAEGHHSALTGGGIGFFVGSVTVGSGPAGGARWTRRDVFGLPLDLELKGMASTQAYQSYGLKLGRLRNLAGVYQSGALTNRVSTEFDVPGNEEGGTVSYIDVNYNYFPREDFFGLGPGSLEANHSDYLLRAAAYEGVLGIQFNKWFGWSARGGLLQVDVDPGKDSSHPPTQSVFAPALTPGVLDQPDFLRFSTGLVADYRDRPADPHLGGLIGAFVSHYNDRGGARYDFTRLALDARQYLPLWSDYRTLALRFLASSDRTPSGSVVPFYFEETLGGITSLRGFPDFRFRDRNLMLMSAEYRWYVADFLQMVLFYDTGKVFSRTSEFDFNRLEKGYGAGIRVKAGERVFARTELAHSREGFILHFFLGPAF